MSETGITIDVIFMFITALSVVVGLYLNTRSVKKGFADQIRDEERYRASMDKKVEKLIDSNIETNKQIDTINRTLSDISENYSKLNIDVALLKKEQSVISRLIDDKKERRNHENI